MVVAEGVGQQAGRRTHSIYSRPLYDPVECAAGIFGERTAGRGHAGYVFGGAGDDASTLTLDDGTASTAAMDVDPQQQEPALHEKHYRSFPVKEYPASAAPEVFSLPMGHLYRLCFVTSQCSVLCR